MKKIFWLMALHLLACALPAHAQFSSGQVLTASALNSAFATKTSNAAAAITGGTITGLSAPLPVASGGTGATTLVGLIAPSYLAAQAADTVLANTTSSPASPVAFAMPSCSTSTSALQYTSGSGFTCYASSATTTGTLAQFASTTSSQLAGVISDESGSGSLLFGNAPTISAPTISGAASFSGTPTFSGGLTISGGTISGVAGRLIGVQVFTAGGTYTPTTGTGSVVVEIQGAGGAGGGAVATGAGQASTGGPGGAGGYVRHRMTSGFSGAAVTVGSAGTGVAGATGNSGGSSSFAGVTAGGGGGGPVSAAGSVVASISGSGGTATGGSIVNAPGQVAGGYSIGINSAGFVAAAPGSNSMFGGGGLGGGIAATGKGAGGGGTVNGASASATTGGAGSPGLVIVWEYQ